MSTPATIISEISALLPEYQALRTEAEYDDLSDLPEERVVSLTTRYRAAIDRLSPAASAYRTSALEAMGDGRFVGNQLRDLYGILVALRADFQDGYLQTIEELIHADLFADFLEMADELLSKGYKDAAAVIAGSVLEEHLRKLAFKSGVPIEQNGKPRKADSLNADLAKTAYNKLEQKTVTAWLDLRNNAAHGHYDQYDVGQVKSMVTDVGSFIVRNPA